MKSLALTAALGVACLGLAACGEREASITNDTAATSEELDGDGMAAGDDGNAGADAMAKSAFPAGARIVEENGVTYRVDAGGTRVRLGPNESRILVEKDVRFRVDPDGTRVRIDPTGVAIDLDGPDMRADVTVGPNGDVDPDVKIRANPDVPTNNSR